MSRPQCEPMRVILHLGPNATEKAKEVIRFLARLAAEAEQLGQGDRSCPSRQSTPA